MLGVGLLLIIQFIPRLAETQQDASWGDPSIYLSLLAAIFGGILVGFGVIPIIGRIRRKCRAKTLFEVTSKEYKDIANSGCVVEASNKPQILSLSIFMKLNTQVQHISITFEGNEGTENTKPIIQRLYDWQRDDNGLPNNVDAHSIKDGKWLWEYVSPWPRLKGSKVTIGIEYRAKNPFNGKLVIGVTTPSDGDKARSLPFIVT